MSMNELTKIRIEEKNVWINMKKEDFYYFINKKRDPNIWRENSFGDWELKDNIINHIKDDGIEEVRLEKIDNCNFKITQNRIEFENDESYLLMGRSYLDKYNYGSLLDKPSDEKYSERTWIFPDI